MRTLGLIIFIFLPINCLGDSSLSFAGGTDRLTITNSGSIGSLSTLTYVFWVYPSSIGANRTITSRVTALGGVKHVVGIDASGNVEGRFRRTGSVSVYTSNDTPLSANTWCFIAVTFDAGASAGQIQNIYKGYRMSPAVEVSYGTTTDGSGTADPDNGNLFLGNNNGSATGWQGSIAFFGMWNRVLSLQEIQDQQFTPHITSGNVVFMNLGFNGTGTQYDLSGNGNNSSSIVGATVSPVGPPISIGGCPL